MLKRPSVALPFLCLLSIGSSLGGCNSTESANTTESATAKKETVGHYDPSRDPAADLEATIAKAQAENKRIILQVGGDWCGWCHRLDAFIADHPAVAEALNNGFVLQWVNKSAENENAEFLSQYPEIPGYPHWYVLESDGTLLHSQGTAALEEGDSYKEQVIIDFLHEWSGNSKMAAI